MRIDLGSVRAVDVHTHAQVPLHGEPDPRTMATLDAAAKHFRSNFPRPNVQQVADYYRARQMAAVVFCVDNQHNTGEVPVSNDEILEVAAANDDVLIPFASIDPRRANAAAEARRLIGKGARGFKFHPTLQGFFPNDRLAYPLYEVIAEARLPALFHTGHSGMGSGLPGGGGLRLGTDRAFERHHCLVKQGAQAANILDQGAGQFGALLNAPTRGHFEMLGQFAKAFGAKLARFALQAVGRQHHGGGIAAVHRIFDGAERGNAILPEIAQDARQGRPQFAAGRGEADLADERMMMIWHDGPSLPG